MTNESLMYGNYLVCYGFWIIYEFSSNDLSNSNLIH